MLGHYRRSYGTVLANANGDIPARALTNYNGPCPPSGSHTYRFTVNALDANGNKIGTGSKSAPFPSN